MIGRKASFAAFGLILSSCNIAVPSQSYLLEAKLQMATV